MSSKASKTYKYRVWFQNRDPDVYAVSEKAQHELGCKIELVTWKVEKVIHFEGLVYPGEKMPQCVRIIQLEYRFKK